LIHSAHDISDGGVAVAVAESCFASDGYSAQVDMESSEQAEFAIFGESGARAVVTCSSEALVRLRVAAAQYRVAAQEIGRVARGEFRIQLNGAMRIAASVDSLLEVWSTALERALQAK
jgi:phosphoribosylformylglycinamidine synthase